MTINANFIQQDYNLTINIDGNGTVAKNPDKSTYFYGDIVELTATPSSGWLFSYWLGDLIGSTNPEIIFMDGNKSITLIFFMIWHILVVSCT